MVLYVLRVPLVLESVQLWAFIWRLPDSGAYDSICDFPLSVSAKRNWFLFRLEGCAPGSVAAECELHVCSFPRMMSFSFFDPCVCRFFGAAFGSLVCVWNFHQAGCRGLSFVWVLCVIALRQMIFYPIGEIVSCIVRAWWPLQAFCEKLDFRMRFQKMRNVCPLSHIGDWQRIWFRIVWRFLSRGGIWG